MTLRIGRLRPPSPGVFMGMAALLLLAWSSASPAQENDDFFAALRQRLVADGFAAEAVSQLYARPEVFVEVDGVSRFFIHSEAKLNYAQFTTPESIERAQQYLQANLTALNSAETAYGVDKRVITAILLVESRLGTTSGSRSALNTLSTLAALTSPPSQEAFWRLIPPQRSNTRQLFEERVQKRAEWGYRELKALLRYAEREGIDPALIPSSYAGAVGYAQFMPTNILAYAQDGNGDGRVDLLNHDDAIASIANYLKRHGWQPGSSPEKQEKAIYAYNPSVYYVNTILKVAQSLKG